MQVEGFLQVKEVYICFVRARKGENTYVSALFIFDATILPIPLDDLSEEDLVRG